MHFTCAFHLCISSAIIALTKAKVWEWLLTQKKCNISVLTEKKSLPFHYVDQNENICLIVLTRMKNNSFIVLAENNSDRIIVEKKSNSWTVLAS